VTAPHEVDQDQAAAAARELDPDAQLDLLDHELARRRAAREAEARRAQAAGGPCSRCGAAESWERPGVGGWAGGDAHGPVCVACDTERGGPAGDDRDHRIRAARQVLGQTPAPEWAGHGDTPAARWWHENYLADAMVWWHEVPGAPPGRGSERFAYLSGPALVARLYQGREPRPPKLYSRGRRHRCAGCGAKGEVWLVEQVGVSAAATTSGERSRTQRAHFRLTWTCSHCRYTDVEQRAEQLPGVPIAGLVG
jgi:hypothetical protein